MIRLLHVAAIAAVALVASTGVASAAVSDDDKRCVYGEEELSLLSEATFAMLREAVQQGTERCVIGLGGQSDCRVSDADGGPVPGGTWTPWSHQPWVAVQPQSAAPPRGSPHHPPVAAVVLCDGYPSELERPPRG